VVAFALYPYRSGTQSDIDPDVVAVAPFDVMAPDLETWREGMVDMLSASLDGAGPLTAVPPSVAILRWEGRADAASAEEFGSNVNAGLVVYGRLVNSGPDSARALATLYDVVSGRVLAEFDIRAEADRIDRLADSLALRVMTDLSQTRPLGGWRLASLGSSSPAALKAFLEGEQYYRRFELDSAQLHYERAIDLDSSFALAYSRRAIARGWVLNFDPVVIPSMLRAGELNHGLAQRESLLLVADSIRGAMGTFRGDSAEWAYFRRLLPTLEYAAMVYPLDPEVWYQLGEARYHEGPFLGVTDEEARAAFARAVELDSSFVPAYKHLTELTLVLQGADAAVDVVEAYLARAGNSVYTDAAQVTAMVLDPQRAGRPETQDALDPLAPEAIAQAWFDLKHGSDSLEAATRVSRAWAAGSDSVRGSPMLALALAYRGRVREAYRMSGRAMPAFFATLTRVGVVPHDTAAAVYHEWLNEGNGIGIYSALRWWLDEGDTLSLARATARWDSMTRSSPPERRERLEDVTLTAESYLALARGDTTRALRAFESLPNWPNCYFCYDQQLVRAQVLANLGRNLEAAELFDHMPFSRQFAPAVDQIVVALERGRVHERLGNREQAIEAYTLVLNAWRTADPELQPMVMEAQAALARLAAEPGAEK
jgi:serine/threonine-protein kinase